MLLLSVHVHSAIRLVEASATYMICDEPVLHTESVVLSVLCPLQLCKASQLAAMSTKYVLQPCYVRLLWIAGLYSGLHE